MKTFTYLVLLSIIIACQKPEAESSKNEDDHTQEMQALQLKLDATEAQLYNARVELSKCKGDSTLLLKTE